MKFNVQLQLVMTWNDVKEGMNAGIQTNSLAQQFIFGNGKKPSFFRLHYFNPYSCALKKNYGYFISNIQTINQQPSKQRSITQRLTVCSQRDFSFQVYTLRGKVIQSYEQQAQSLIDYISRSFKIRISQIITDFVKDEKGVIFFLNVRSFKLDRDPKLLSSDYMTNTCMLDDFGSQKDIDMRGSPSKFIMTKDQPHNLVRCGLCRHLFSKKQAKKLLTVSMIQTLIQHLGKRGVFDLDQLMPKITVSIYTCIIKKIIQNENNNQRNNSCRLCDLCYILIVSEHQLIQIESKFAKGLNIPIIDDQQYQMNQFRLTYLSPKQKSTAIQGQIIPNNKKKISNYVKQSTVADIGKQTLQQWRLMFYIQNIYDIKLDDLPAKNQLYLQLKYMNYITKFKLTKQDSFKPNLTIQTKTKQFAEVQEVDDDEDEDVKLVPPSNNNLRNQRFSSKINTIQSQDYFDEDQDDLSQKQNQNNGKNGAYRIQSLSSDWAGSSGKHIKIEHSDKNIVPSPDGDVGEDEQQLKLAIKMNKVRLHYFFGQTYSDVKDFISQVELELRVTDGTDWNSILAMGSCFPFSHFQIVDGFNVGRERLQIHLFSQHIDNFFLNVNFTNAESLLDVLWTCERQAYQIESKDKGRESEEGLFPSIKLLQL